MPQTLIQELHLDRFLICLCVVHLVSPFGQFAIAYTMLLNKHCQLGAAIIAQCKHKNWMTPFRTTAEKQNCNWNRIFSDCKRMKIQLFTKLCKSVIPKRMFHQKLGIIDKLEWKVSRCTHAGAFSEHMVSHGRRPVLNVLHEDGHLTLEILVVKMERSR
ncbi:hypothetical protein J3R30DRAFT_3555066 [Lentinula aciculospora]|uniref:Uncharacterized protein n=1 Tax=Lentinula aciculospora TaxID=153920 RepID=A0A9W9DH45_9AGAR|nr:hypothetical protein J3R30DRAFT_3555066 [Lentinula aciculospora]